MFVAKHPIILINNYLMFFFYNYGMFGAKHPINRKSDHHLKIGRIGEEKAKEYLLNIKHRIIAVNHKEGFDEIDIISRDVDGTLVFSEVKTIIKQLLNLSEGFMPEDHFNIKKRHRIERAIQKFTAKRPDLVWENWGWRVDLIAITLSERNIFTLNHYENI